MPKRVKVRDSLHLPVEIPKTWAELSTHVTVGDDWVRNVYEVVMGFKKLAIIDYDEYESPADIEEAYKALGLSPEELAEFREFQDELEVIRDKTGSKILFLPQYRRNAELLRIHFDDDIGNSTLRSLLLGYSTLSCLGYEFWGEHIMRDEDNLTPEKMEKRYQKFLRDELRGELAKIARARSWIMRKGGDAS